MRSARPAATACCRPSPCGCSAACSRPTPSPGSAATGSSSCAPGAASRRTPPRWRGRCWTRWPSRMRCRGGRWWSAPASASPSRRRMATSRTRCCGMPALRSAAPNPDPAGLRCFELAMDARMQARRTLELDLRRALERCRPELGGTAPARRNSWSTTSRRSTCGPTRCAASRRWSAGATRSAGWCRPVTSSRWPRSAG